MARRRRKRPAAPAARAGDAPLRARELALLAALFALLALGVVWLRRRPEYKPAWRMPLVPLAPLLFVLVAAAIVVNQIRADPANSAIGLLIVASGLPGYYLWNRKT